MPNLLIVDDAAFMRLSIRKMVEKHGYEVVGEACDGVEAVKFCKESEPDVITMDITMPNMTGIEALKEIRTFNPKVKVVMVSAMGQENLIKDAVISGASSFIVKPFKEDKLIEVLNGVVK